MTAKQVTAAAALLALATPAHAAPPTLLSGKSVVIAWNETRVQRNVGDPSFRTVNARHELSVYVSSAGRVFSRLHNSTGAGSAATDQVHGAGGATRVPSFSGQAMTIFAPFQAGGMRRVSVDFDAGFGGCSAKVTYAKQEGVARSVSRSPITKQMIEFESVNPGVASCSVKSGNVFGE
jgi:hypothetical protein